MFLNFFIKNFNKLARLIFCTGVHFFAQGPFLRTTVTELSHILSKLSVGPSIFGVSSRVAKAFMSN